MPVCSTIKIFQLADVHSFIEVGWIIYKNVFLVQDLLGDDGKVLSYSEFFRKFQLNGNFLQYMQVVSAIPKNLMDDARRCHIDKTSILYESSFQFSADLSLDLLKMKNRNYYWLLISKDQHETRSRPPTWNNTSKGIISPVWKIFGEITTKRILL